MMNELEFNIRLYLTGTMKSWTDRIDSSLSDDDLELIRLRYMERLTLSEVASRYLLHEHTIRNHTNPTIKQVKKIIKQGNELSIKQKSP